VGLAGKACLAYSDRKRRIEEKRMNCPVCKEDGARRSRRNGIAEYLVSIIGLYPWRCRSCHVRFYARLMPLSHSMHSHCPICGNLKVKRISAAHVVHPFTPAFRLLRVPAFRCEPCRHKYFSLLPQRQTEEETARPAAAD